MKNTPAYDELRARSFKTPPDYAPAAAPPDYPPPAPPKFARLLDSLTSDERKTYPMASGLHDYFPDALAAVAHISWQGNEKHNPGQDLHWSRGKSNDHADCAQRHLDQRGGFDTFTIGMRDYKARHTAQLAWRALALLQEELENEFDFELPRGARGRDV